MKGHWTGPASAALGLAFDYRCMSSDRGLFFTGQVTQPMVQEIIKAKCDDYLQREGMIFNNKRFGGEECAKHGAVDIAAPNDEILEKGLELAQSLVAKGKGPARKALGGIKRNVYKTILDNVGEQKAMDALKMSNKVAKGLGGGSASVGQDGGKISAYPTAPAKNRPKL